MNIKKIVVTSSLITTLLISPLSIAAETGLENLRSGSFGISNNENVLISLFYGKPNETLLLQAESARAGRTLCAIKNVETGEFIQRFSAVNSGINFSTTSNETNEAELYIAGCIPDSSTIQNVIIAVELKNSGSNDDEPDDNEGNLPFQSQYSPLSAEEEEDLNAQLEQNAGEFLNNIKR